MAILEPRDLGIIVSYLCGSRCRHCLYNCGPEWEAEPMSPGMLREALDSAATWPEPPQVHLTGGEPFLHFDLLREGAAHAAALGLTCYVETSAVWCTSEEEAEVRFADLLEAGLSAVLISCSPFHAERIPPVRTFTAIRAAQRVFGPSGVMVYLPEYVGVLARLGLGRPTPLDRYYEVFGPEAARRLLWDGYGIIAGGRAGYRLGHLATRRPAAAFADADCRGQILHAPHSHFDLYGHFIPAFCGGLSLGDWRELGALLDEYRRGSVPVLLSTLIAGGPHGLYAMAREQLGYVPLADGYAGKCHLCVDVRRHLARSGDYPELRPRPFYDRI